MRVQPASAKLICYLWPFSKEGKVFEPFGASAVVAGDCVPICLRQ